jgi:hypothetical protein
MDQRDIVIITQVAYKEAVQLAISSGLAPDADLLIDQLRTLTSIGVSVMTELAASAAPAAQAHVQAAFPGAAPAPFAPNPAPAFAPQPAFAAPQPAPQGGGLHPSSSPEERWMDLITNPHNWTDNRQSKRNPNAPDFSHNWLRSADGKSVALWAYYQGTLKVPDFARAALGY